MTPDAKLIDVYDPRPARQRKPIRSRATAFTLNASEEVFLMEWMCNGGDHVQALKKAGYSASNADRRQAHQILKKIDRACEIGDVFDLAGYGVTAWVERLLSLAYSDNLKARAVAVRLWGLARQYFSGAPPVQGASINVHVMQPPGEVGATAAPQLVQVTLNALREAMPADREHMPHSQTTESVE
jgi:hypothetical protein